MRQDFNYEGLKMELDETTYEWGTCYEIEIETVRSLLFCSYAGVQAAANCNWTLFCEAVTPTADGAAALIIVLSSA